jgi:leucyl aminopeptidase
MKPQVSLSNKAAIGDAIVILVDKKSNLNKSGLTNSEVIQFQKWVKQDIKSCNFIAKDVMKFVQLIDINSEDYKTQESLRKKGSTLLSSLNKYKLKSISIHNYTGVPAASISFAEGIALTNYQFIQYRQDATKKAHSLKQIKIIDSTANKNHISELNIMIDAVYMVRDLVNEPVNHLNAVQLADAFVKAGKEANFKTTVFNKKKIEELGMGGLLSVNQGSIDPPTFTIMEYKPANALNDKPIVLVGKGVVYDTGGLSLKPTGNSMDYMKCDMAGSATVMGSIYMAARNNWPLHIIALAPSTDNRLNGNAFAPGDIIKMYNGMTVEMLNSDAEGRMILADALSYAQQYEPSLVIDIATLTGAAHRALGDHAIAYMSTANENINKQLEQSGRNVYERLVYFPLWDEYGDMLDSDIADMKNVGGALAGQITAGKFLEKYTNYPWIHLDIAGMAFFHSSQGYKGKNASAIGLRLITDFLKNQMNELIKK